MHFFNMLKKATPEVFIIILIIEKRNISMASGQNAFSLGELLKSCGIFFHATPGLAKEKRDNALLCKRFEPQIALR